jgi:hypothetical protein
MRPRINAAPTTPAPTPIPIFALLLRPPRPPELLSEAATVAAAAGARVDELVEVDALVEEASEVEPPSDVEDDPCDELVCEVNLEGDDTDTTDEISVVRIEVIVRLVVTGATVAL